MPVAHAVAMLLPVPRMRDRQLLHEGAQVPVVLRPEHQMPMVGHQAIRYDPHRAGFQRFGDEPLESLEVGIAQKQAPSVPRPD